MAGSTVVEPSRAMPVQVAAADGGDAPALLQAAADPVRWAILSTLSGGPLCVCDIQARVPVPGNLLSYHLKVLRTSGLVTSSRRGRWVDYAVADDAHARLVASLPGSRPPASGPTGADGDPGGRCGGDRP